jgi:hypothetical protein
MLLALLLAGLIGAAIGFAWFLSSGLAVALVALAVGGTLGIVLAAGWLALTNRYQKTLH